MNLLHSLIKLFQVSIRDLRQDTEVFIALAVFDEKSKGWTTSFPASVYSQVNRQEDISLPFEHNKMVVGKNWRNTDFSITPWRFFDSLAGIEFVSSMDYYLVLQPEGKNSEVSGRSVYMRRCQYCHGVGDFGAKFGPNFATLLSSDKDKASEMILRKVLPDEKSVREGKHRAARMPKQDDFTKTEAKDLVNWLSSRKNSANNS